MSLPITRIEQQRQTWSRMYRAQVEFVGRVFSELAVFVEADSELDAQRVILQLCSDLRRPADEAIHIHEIRSASHLLDVGNSAESFLRLFEKGSNAEGHIVWIRAPLFILREPVELLERWAAMPLKWRRGK